MGAQRMLQIFTLNIAYIVEGAILDRHACQLNRFNPCYRRYFACTADLPGYGFQNSCRFLRFKLEGDRPAWKLVGVSQRLARPHIDNLNNCTVY
ncbi:hypothetical protein D3C78_1152290 [compost metagenome]